MRTGRREREGRSILVLPPPLPGYQLPGPTPLPLPSSYGLHRTATSRDDGSGGARRRRLLSPRGKGEDERVGGEVGPRPPPDRRARVLVRNRVRGGKIDRALLRPPLRRPPPPLRQCRRRLSSPLLPRDSLKRNEEAAVSAPSTFEPALLPPFLSPLPPLLVPFPLPLLLPSLPSPRRRRDGVARRGRRLLAAVSGVVHYSFLIIFGVTWQSVRSLWQSSRASTRLLPADHRSTHPQRRAFP